MPTFDNASAPAPALPLQFVDIKITPLLGGAYSVMMGATLLDEEKLEFIGQDLAFERVETLDGALAIIRQNVGVLTAPVSGWGRR